MTTDGMGRETDRFVVERDGKGWRVLDTLTGHFHTARLADRSRAVMIAARKSEAMARPYWDSKKEER